VRPWPPFEPLSATPCCVPTAVSIGLRCAPGLRRSTGQAKLEEILHPLIRLRSDACCAAAEHAPYVLLVVPLLVETASYRQRADRVLVVDCDEALQIARVMARSGLAAEAVRRSWQRRRRVRERRAVADDVVLNEGGLDALLPQVDGLHRAIWNWPVPNFMLGVEVLLQMLQNYRKFPFPTLAAV
jgi:hypothetical protein